ncbi:MAG: glycosyltransferase family 4 protein, partial [Bryobacteraceae bacterium]
GWSWKTNILRDRKRRQCLVAATPRCDGLGDLFLLRNGHLPCYCFCHTPLRPCFDPEYFQRVAPKYHGWKKLPLHMARSGFRAIDRWLWRRYRYVFFNSEETLGRARAGGLLRSIGDRYEIAHPGLDVNRSPVSERFEPFFLVPGRIMWTKNIESAVAGFLEMKRRGPGTAAFRMVVAGHVDEKSRPYLQALRRLAAGREDIEFVISPSDAELSDLYRRCYAAVFTAWNEDWGMAPLEANAAGKPVLASRRGGLLESQVDGVTGFLVEPEVSDIAAGLLRLAKSPARVRMMGAIARLRVARFDWSNLVRRIDDVLEERAGDPGCRTESARPASCVRVSIPLEVKKEAEHDA